MCLQAFLRERNLELPVEVEASSITQVQEVLDLLGSEPQCMVTRIMLDNMARLDPSAPGAHASAMPNSCNSSVMYRPCKACDLRSLNGVAPFPVFCTDAWRFPPFVSAGGIDVSSVREAVSLINGRVETEASGNVTLASVATIASTGVSFISCGALTHSVIAMDISLNIETH